MSLKLNSPEQLVFYEELKQAGKLVDFYSENQQSMIEDYDEDWLKDFDEEYGYAYRNHLLMAQMLDWSDEQMNKLFQLFPSLKAQFRAGVIHPKILFFNLATQQILCVGLGRKYSSFYIDSETNVDCNPNLNFNHLDYHGFIDDALNYLEDFSSSRNEWWGLPNNEEDIRSLLKEEPSDDGQYRFEDEGDDDEGHTKEDLEEMLEELDRLNMIMDQAKDFYVRFFPDMDFYELMRDES